MRHLRKRNAGSPSCARHSVAGCISVDKGPTADQIAKVRAFDLDASELTAGQIIEKPDLVLIDAEHTNVGVVQATFSAFTLYAIAAAIYTLARRRSHLQRIAEHREVSADTPVWRLSPMFFPPSCICWRRTRRRNSAVRWRKVWTGWRSVCGRTMKNQLINFHYEVVRQRLA